MSAAVPCQGIGLLYGTADTHRQRQRRGRTDLFGEGFHWCVPVRESIYFALYRAAGTVFFDGSLRVRPSLAYRVPWPSVNTSSMYFFTVHGAPIHQPASARSPHQPRESFVLPLWHRSRCRRERCEHHARGRAVCHPRLRSGCRSVDHWVGEFFAPLIIRMLLIFNLKVRRLPTIVRHRAVRWN